MYVFFRDFTAFFVTSDNIFLQKKVPVIDDWDAWKMNHKVQDELVLSP